MQIVLSTYNGEKFLNDLLNSLLAQDYPNIAILIRDDGSKVNTINILRCHEGLFNIEVLYDKNIGLIESFFELLKRTADEADYVAFCDQDDVWVSDKISRAVAQLEERVPPGIPGMYCSRYNIVDESLKIIGYSQIPKRGPSFENALVQNIATGCTVVINREARLKIVRELPQVVIMHDWWIYQVVSAFGIVIYDSYPTVLYRQHASNVVGESGSLTMKWARRLVRFVRQGRLNLVVQAQEFLRIYGEELSGEKNSLLKNFVSKRKGLWSRLKYAAECKVHRQTFLENVALRILIILNRI